MPILSKCFSTVAYKSRQLHGVITNKDMEHDNIHCQQRQEKSLIYVCIKGREGEKCCV